MEGENNNILAFSSIFEVFVISCVGSIVAPGHGGALTVAGLYYGRGGNDYRLY